ncbi:MAG TPA: hypothetical protein VES20_09965 [Bryobacteraceae bacterium]|nr:hypothetical protein [Bryobacteraceae bacterium]
MKRMSVLAAGLLLGAGLSAAAEKTVLHCFAYSPVGTATQADWDAFHKATDELPTKIKGLQRVWVGKLARPLNQYSLTNAEQRKTITAAGKGTGDVSLMRREYGVCMEFADEAAFKAYDADPAHKTWVEAYGKVRVPGTTTYQIIPNR